MLLSKLFFGTNLKDENGKDYSFINHCFCDDNNDPKLTFVDKKENKIVEFKLSQIQEWKIQD